MGTGIILRRTRQKLDTLLNTPYIQWVMGDLINIVVEDLEDEGCTYGEYDKAILIKKLKEQYELYIKNNENRGMHQGELDII